MSDAEPRCRCPKGTILGDCPLGYANGGHERGETYGKTEDEYQQYQAQLLNRKNRGATKP